MLFSVSGGVFITNCILTQRETFQNLVKRPRRLQETLVIDELFHIGMEVGFLLNSVVDLLEELFVNQRLDAANREMWNEVLSVAKIAEAIESIQHIVFEIIQGFRDVVHAEPQHTRRAVTAKDSCMIEVHREWLVPLRHLTAGLVNGRDVKVFGLTYEFQGKVYVFRPAIVDVFFMRQAFFQVFHQSRVFRPARNVYG